MKRKHTIILRKRIQNEEIIKKFETLTKMKLPYPPLEIPIKKHTQILTWEMDMTKESARNEYQKLVNLFELPFRTNSAKRLLFIVHRKCWYDILFEVYESPEQ